LKQTKLVDYIVSGVQTAVCTDIFACHHQ
jgi:hypothetical protein